MNNRNQIELTCRLTLQKSRSWTRRLAQSSITWVLEEEQHKSKLRTWTRRLTLQKSRLGQICWYSWKWWNDWREFEWLTSLTKYIVRPNKAPSQWNRIGLVRILFLQEFLLPDQDDQRLLLQNLFVVVDKPSIDRWSC